MGWRIIAMVLVAGLLVAQKIPPATFNGAVHGVTNKQVTIENEAGNLLDFEINKKTKILRGAKTIPVSDLQPGEVVSIEAREEMGRYLVALSVTAQPKPEN
jgi:hypothetical protein